MKHIETVERHDAVLKVAIQRELAARHWQPPVRRVRDCPFCGSANTGKLMTHRDGNTHCCRDCKQRFSAEDIKGCTCWYPGKLRKCQQCPQYRQIKQAIKERLNGELAAMTLQEAQALLVKPETYDKSRLNTSACPRPENKACDKVGENVLPKAGDDTTEEPQQLSLL